MKDVTNVKIQVEDILYMDTKVIHVSWIQDMGGGGGELASGYNVHISNSMLNEIFLSADPDRFYDLLMQAFKPVFALGSVMITTALCEFVHEQVAAFYGGPKFTLAYKPAYKEKSLSDELNAREAFSSISWKLPSMTKEVKNPVTGEMKSLRTVIIDLNDSHGWTREKIADWLETLDVDIRFRKDENDTIGNEV